MIDYFYQFLLGKTKKEQPVTISIPEEPLIKTWTWLGLNSLNTDWQALDNLSFDKAKLLIYSINYGGKTPFLEFGFKKIPKVETESFCLDDYILPYMVLGKTKEELREGYTKKLDVFFSVKNETERQYKYKGFFLQDDELYLVVDISEWKKNDVILLSRNDFLWFATIDEIVNHKSVCQFPMDRQIGELFEKREEFLILKDENGIVAETPIVAYTGCQEKKLKMEAVFGPSKSIYTTETGPYYHFTDYIRAFEQAGWSKDHKPEYMYNELVTDAQGKYLSGGIVRYALFLGEMTMIKDDWSFVFDSLYLMQDKAPVWIVKKYNQLVPISYHFIDKSTLTTGGPYLIL